jgi:hypothetical protein
LDSNFIFNSESFSSKFLQFYSHAVIEKQEAERKEMERTCQEGNKSGKNCSNEKPKFFNFLVPNNSRQKIK